MPRYHVFDWIDGSGWLILSGDPDSLGEIRAQVLTRVKAEGAVAYVGVSAQDSDDIIDDFGELGAPAGYLVNVMVEDDESIRQRLATASLVVVSGSVDAATLRAGLAGAADTGMREAFARGAVILAEGTAAMLFGSVVMTGEGVIVDGLDWLHGAFVVPEMTTVSESAQAREVLISGRAGLAVGLGRGSALALGTEPSVQIWGDQVTVALGKGTDPLTR